MLTFLTQDSGTAVSKMRAWCVCKWAGHLTPISPLEAAQGLRGRPLTFLAVVDFEWLFL